MRLDKYLSDMKIGTRSEVKKLIKKGVILVNEQVVTKPEYAIVETCDHVVCQGNEICYETYLYYLLHKPAGYVCATKDNLYPTVLDLIDIPRKDVLFPVGRLDVDTEGLVLLTNDGALAHELLAPKKHVSKRYLATIEGVVTEEEVARFQEGLDLGDFYTKPAKLTIHKVEGNHSIVEVTIVEGKFHQVKRMFQVVGMKVIYLKRLQMGELILPHDLLCGAYRKLTRSEVIEGIG